MGGGEAMADRRMKGQIVEGRKEGREEGRKEGRKENPKVKA